MAKQKLEVNDAVVFAEGGEVALSDEYRPPRWEDVVGQEEAIKRIGVIGRRGIGGRAWWISGQSGVGKTTIAKLISRQVAEEFCEVELNAGKLRAEVIIEQEHSLQTYGIGPKLGRSVIINEAHWMSQGSVRQLLDTLERIPRHVVWIFTTTADGENQKYCTDPTDAKALISRCVVLKLQAEDSANEFARRAQWIARKEGLDGQPLKAYEQLARDCSFSLREMIFRIESGAMLDNSVAPRGKKR